MATLLKKTTILFVLCVMGLQVLISEAASRAEAEAAVSEFSKKVGQDLAAVNAEYSLSLREVDATVASASGNVEKQLHATLTSLERRVHQTAANSEICAQISLNQISDFRKTLINLLPACTNTSIQIATNSLSKVVIEAENYKSSVITCAQIGVRKCSVVFDPPSCYSRVISNLENLIRQVTPNFEILKHHFYGIEQNYKKLPCDDLIDVDIKLFSTNIIEYTKMCAELLNIGPC